MRELNLRLSNYKSDELVALIKFLDGNLDSLVKAGIKINISMVKHIKGAPAQGMGEYSGQKLRNIKAIRIAVDGLLNRGTQVDEHKSAMQSFQADALAGGDDEEYHGSSGEMNIKNKVNKLMARRDSQFAPKSHISQEEPSDGQYEQSGNRDLMPPPSSKSRVDPERMFGSIGSKKPSTEKVGGLDGDILSSLAARPDGKNPEDRVGEDYDLMSMMLSSRQDTDALLS